MISQNFSTPKSKTAFRILKISAIFLTIIILFFGSVRQSFAAEVFGVNVPGVPEISLSSIAAGIGAAALDVASMIAEFIFYLLGVISGTILTLGGYLLDLGLELNRAIIESEMVTKGYPITLSIVNLFFILAIIIIAFITILRYEGYDIKKLLTRLIIAAVLINFSLTLAGLVLDFTGVFSNFFVHQATSSGSANFSENLVGYLQPQTHLLKQYENADIDVGLLEFSGATINLLVKTFMATLFTLIMAVVILAIAFMIFIRYIALVILVILMPLAWMLWIIPGTENHSRRWWNEFIKWNFFLPAVTFFLYLSMLISFSPAKDIGTGEYLPSQIGIALQDFGNMIIALGLLVGGLMAAQKFGIYGSNAAMAWVTQIKNAVIGAAGKIGRRTIGAPAARLGADILSKKGIQLIPGARFLRAKLAEVGSREKDIAEYTKSLSGLTNEQKQRLRPLFARGKFALLKSLASSKGLSGFIDKLSEPGNESELESYVQAAMQMSGIKKGEREKAAKIPEIQELLATNPLLAEKLQISSPEAIARKLDFNKAQSLSTEALSDPRILFNLSSGIYKRLKEELSGEQQAAMREAENKISETFKEAEKSNPGSGIDTIRNKFNITIDLDKHPFIVEKIRTTPGLAAATTITIDKLMALLPSHFTPQFSFSLSKQQLGAIAKESSDEIKDAIRKAFETVSDEINKLQGAGITGEEFDTKMKEIFKQHNIKDEKNYRKLASFVKNNIPMQE